MSFVDRMNGVILSTLLVGAQIAPYAFVHSASADGQDDWEQALLDKQRPVRVEAFGAEYTDEFIRLSLNEAPRELEEVEGAGPEQEWFLYTAVYLSDEYFSSAQPGELTEQQTADLDAVHAKAYLTVGTIDGPSGTAHMVGVYHTATDENDVTYHHLVPIGEASLDLVTRLAEMTAVVLNGVPVAQVSKDPCDSITYCHDLYRQRISQALKDFADCMKGNVPPLSLCAVACFVLCAPFVLGTPAAYLACVAGCLAGCGLVGGIEWQTCEDQLEADEANAKSSYSNCIAWKEANCQPQDWEPDVVGCDQVED